VRVGLLLDTHLLLWLDNGDPRLLPKTRSLIDRRWLAGGSVLVSAVFAWEIALLADTGRISLGCPPGGLAGPLPRPPRRCSGSPYMARGGRGLPAAASSAAIPRTGC